MTVCFIIFLYHTLIVNNKLLLYYYIYRKQIIHSESVPLLGIIGSFSGSFFLYQLFFKSFFLILYQLLRH